MHRPVLPQIGFVRLAALLPPGPVSQSAWWDGVRNGRYSQPIKLGPRTTAWRVEDIRALLDQPGITFAASQTRARR